MSPRAAPKILLVPVLLAEGGVRPKRGFSRQKRTRHTRIYGTIIQSWGSVNALPGNPFKSSRCNCLTCNYLVWILGVTPFCSSSCASSSSYTRMPQEEDCVTKMLLDIPPCPSSAPSAQQSAVMKWYCSIAILHSINALLPSDPFLHPWSLRRASIMSASLSFFDVPSTCLLER